MTIEQPTVDSTGSLLAAHATAVRVGDELCDDVANGLAGTLNMRRVALRLLTLIRPRLADWSMLVLPDPRSGGVLVLGGDDTGFHAIAPQADVDPNGVGAVLRTGRTELVHVALGLSTESSLASMIPHPRLRAEAEDFKPADLLGVGLSARGSSFGALVMVRGQGHGFDDHDIAVAERVASRAALALDSARLYEERSRVATVLQSSLRPPSLPHVEGAQLAARYRPAAEDLDIGGDFYDVHGADGDWMLSIGDVCGKGVEAAALTGRTRQSIRTAGYFDRHPEVVLGALNTVLRDAGTPDFVTALCGRMQVGLDGVLQLDIASAGHPSPIVLRADGRVEQMTVGGTAVGLRSDVSYTPVHVELHRGDTILMYTDGIDEAGGADGQYGVDRLVALLGPLAGAGSDVVCEAVEQDVIEFLDGRPHDDMALLAVTCTP